MRSRTEITNSIMTKPQSKWQAVQNIIRPSSWKSTAVGLRAQRSKPKASLSQAFPRVPCSGEKGRRKRQGWDCSPLSNHQAEFRAPPAGGSEGRQQCCINICPSTMKKIWGSEEQWFPHPVSLSFSVSKPFGVTVKLGINWKLNYFPREEICSILSPRDQLSISRDHSPRATTTLFWVVLGQHSFAPKCFEMDQNHTMG